MFWNTGVTAKNEVRVVLIVGIMLSAMLLPAFSFHPSLPSLRLDEMLLFGFFGLNFLFLLKNRFQLTHRQKIEYEEQKKALKKIYTIFALLLISYIISNLYGCFFKAGSYTLRDVMELATFFKYFLILTLVVSVRIGEDEYSFLSRSFLAGLIILILFGWAQHLNPLNINTWLSPFFNQSHWEHLLVGNPARVLGTFDNPNVFGTFTVMALAFLTTRYYFVERGKFPLLLFILIGLVIKLEYLTISRTALFGIALVFTILSIWAFIHYGKNKKIMVKIGALFLLTVFLFVTASADFLYRVAEGMDFSNSTSFQGHVQQWGMAVGSIWDSPVFGWGTQKSTMTTIVDNEYALYARRYGFIGLAFYLWFFFQPFLIAWQRVKTRQGMQPGYFDRRTWFAAAFIAVLPAILVYNFMAGIFYNLQLMTLFALFMGLVYNTVREEH